MTHRRTDAVVALSDARHRYPGELRDSISDVTVTLRRGESVALIGPSGAGKSTLLALLDGRLDNWTGKAQVLGQPLRPGRKPPRSLRSKVGFIFQEFALVERATARQNVLNGRLGHIGTWPSLLGRFSDADYAAVETAMIDAEISELADKRADRLSGGQRQRVAIARCLAQEPQIILADEPISNLDPRRAEHVLALLRGIARRRGASLIFSSHQPTLALPFADRVVAMHEGRVVHDGTPDGLAPAHLAKLYGSLAEAGGTLLRLAC